MRASASKVQSERRPLWQGKTSNCRRARFLADSIAVWLTAGLFFAPMAQAAVAQTAIRPDANKTATTVTVGQNGHLHDITTESVRNQVGLNAFKQFDLAGGDIANLRLPGGAHTLLNFVDQRINIDGTLNALKDNRIGGNVFFISQQGMAVGAGGVINVGALGVVTPTKDEYLKLTAGRLDSNTYLASHVGDIASGNLPINASGSIAVAGQINAVGDASLRSAAIRVEKTGRVRTGVTNFAGLVNLAHVDSGVRQLTATRDPGTGKVVIEARNDYAENAPTGAIVVDLLTGVKVSARAEIKASVEHYGQIDAANDVRLTATAVNGDDDYRVAGANLLGHTNASVTVGDGTTPASIRCDGDLTAAGALRIGSGGAVLEAAGSIGAAGAGNAFTVDGGSGGALVARAQKLYLDAGANALHLEEARADGELRLTLGGGKLTADALRAGGDATIAGAAGAGSVVDSLTANGQAGLTLTGGALTVRQMDANSLSAAVTGGKLTLGDSLTKATTAVVAARLDATLRIEGDGAIDAKAVSAGRDATVEIVDTKRHTNDPVQLEFVRAGRDATLRVTNSNLSVTDVVAGRDLNIALANGDLTLADGGQRAGLLAARNDLRLNVRGGGSIRSNGQSVNAIAAGRDAYVTTDGNFAFGRVIAVGDAVLTATQGDLKGDAVDAGGSARLTAEQGGIEIARDVVAGKDAVLTAATGILVTEAITAGNDANLTNKVSGSMKTALLKAGNDATVLMLRKNETGVAGEIDIGRISAARDVSLQTGEESPYALNAHVDVKLGSIDAGRDLAIKTGTDSRAGIEHVLSVQDGFHAGRDILLQLRHQSRGNQTHLENVLAERNANLFVGDSLDLKVDRLFAGGDLTAVVAQNGNLTLTSETMTAGGNLTYLLEGDSNVKNLLAGGDIIAQTTVGKLAFSSLTAGQDIKLVRNAGTGTDISFDTLHAGRSVSMTLAPSSYDQTDTGIKGNSVTAERGEIRIDSAGLIGIDKLSAGSNARLLAANGIAGRAAGAAADISAGRFVSLENGGGDVRVGSLSTQLRGEAGVGSGVKAVLHGGAADIGRIVSASDVLLAAEAGTSYRIGQVEAAGDVDVALNHSHFSLTGQALRAGRDVHFVNLGGTSNVTQLIANRDVYLEGDGDFTLSRLEAGGNATAISRNGNLDFGALQVAGDALLEAKQNGGVHLGASEVGRDLSVYVGAGGVAADGALYAGRDLTLEVLRGSIDVKDDKIGAGNNVKLVVVGSGSNNRIALNQIEAGNDVNVKLADGRLDLSGGGIQAGGSLALRLENSAVQLSGDELRAKGDIELYADRGSINAKRVVAGENASITLREGDLALQLLEAKNGGVRIDVQEKGNLTLQAVAAGSDIDVAMEQGVFNLTGGALAAKRDIRFNNEWGQSNIARVVAGRNAEVRANGDLVLEQLAAGGDLTAVSNTGRLVFDALRVGGNASVTAKAGGVKLGQSEVQGDFGVYVGWGGIETNGALWAGRDLTLDVKGGTIRVENDALRAGGNVTASIDAGGVVALKRIEAGNDVSVTLRKGALQLADGVQAGNDLSIAALDGGRISVAGQALTARGNVSLRADSGSVDVNRVEAGKNASVSLAGGDLALAFVKAGGDARFDVGAQGNLTLKALAAGGDVGISLDQGNFALTGGALAARGNVSYVSHGGTSNIARVEAGGDASLQSDGALTLQQLAAGGSVRLATDSDLTLNGNLRANKDATLTAGGDIVFGGNLAVGGDVTLAASQGSIRFAGGALTAGGDLTLAALNDIAAGLAQAGGSLQASAERLRFTSLEARGGDLVAIAGSSLEAQSIRAAVDADLTARAGGALRLGSADAGRDLRLRTESGAFELDGSAKAGRNLSIAVLGGTARTGGGSLIAGGDLAGRFIADGQVHLSRVVAGGDAALTLERGTIELTGGMAVAGDLDVSLRDKGALRIAGRALAAGGDVALTMNDGFIDATRLLAGGDATLALTNGALTLDEVRAGGDARFTVSGKGALVLREVNAARDIGVDVSRGSFALDGGALRAGRDVDYAMAGGTSNISRIEAVRDARVEALGDFALGGLQAGGDAAIAVKSGALILAVGGAAHVGGDLAIEADRGVATGALEAGGSVRLANAAGDVSTGAIAAGSDVAIDVANGKASFGGIAAARDLSIAAKRASVAVNGLGDTLYAKRDVSLTLDGGTLLVSRVEAERNATVALANGVFSLDLLRAKSGDAQIRVGELGALTLRGVVSGGDIGVELNRGRFELDGGALVAKRDVDFVNRDGQSNIAHIEAGRDARLDVNGDLSLRQLAAGNDATVTSERGDLSFDTLRAGNSVSLTAAAGNIAVNSVVQAGQDIKAIAEFGDIAALDLETARGDIVLQAQGGALRAGLVRAGGSASLAAASGLMAGAVTAQRDVAVRSDGGALAAGALMARDGNVTATIGSGRATLGAVQAGQNALLQVESVGALMVNGAVHADGDVRADVRFGTLTANGGVFAGGDLAVDILAGQVVLRGDVTATRDASVALRAGEIELDPASLMVGNDLRLDIASQGNLKIGQDAVLTAGRDVRVNVENSDVDAAVAGIAAGRDAQLSLGRGTLQLDSVTARRDISLSVAELGELTVGTMQAGNDIAVELQRGKFTLTGGKLEAAHDVVFTNHFGMTNIEEIAANNDAMVTVNGDATLKALRAGRNATVESKLGKLQINEMSADAGDATVTTGLSELTIGNLTARLGDARVETRGGETQIANMQAGQNASASLLAGALQINSLKANADATLRVGRLGTMTLGTIDARQDINVAIASGALHVTGTNGELKAGRDVNATIRQRGELDVRKIVAGRDASVSLGGGTLALETVLAGRDIALAIEADGAMSLNTIAAKRDLSAKVNRGTLRVQDGVLAADRDVIATVDAGVLAVNQILAGEDADVTLRNGQLTLGQVKAGEDARFTVGNGRMTLGKEIDAGRDIEASLQNGALNFSGQDTQELHAKRNLTLSLDNGFVNVNRLSAGEAARVALRNGKLDLDYVGAQDIGLTVENAGILQLRQLEASRDLTVLARHGVLRAPNGELKAGRDVTLYIDRGDVNVNTIEAGRHAEMEIASGDLTLDRMLARANAIARAKDGNIAIGYIEGTDIYFELGNAAGRTETNEIRAGRSVTSIGNEFSAAALWHTGTDDFLEIKLDGVAGGPMRHVELPYIYSATGVHIDGLYTDTANIHADARLLRLDNMSVQQKAQISNDNTVVSVFGRDPVYDSSDLQLWYDAAWRNPPMYLYFLSQPHRIDTNAYLLSNKHGFGIDGKRSVIDWMETYLRSRARVAARRRRAVRSRGTRRQRQPLAAERAAGHPLRQGTLGVRHLRRRKRLTVRLRSAVRQKTERERRDLRPTLSFCSTFFTLLGRNQFCGAVLQGFGARRLRAGC